MVVIASDGRSISKMVDLGKGIIQGEGQVIQLISASHLYLEEGKHYVMIH